MMGNLSVKPKRTRGRTDLTLFLFEEFNGMLPLRD